MLVFALALVFVPPVAVNAEVFSAEQISAAARAEISKSRYQRELPDPPSVERDPSRGENGSRRPPASTMEPPLSGPRVPLFESTSDAARAVLWVLLGIVVVLLVVYISNEIPRFLRGRSRSVDPLSDVPATNRGEQQILSPDGIGEADRLARSGAYGPAIHSLLLALIDTLYGRVGRRLSRSLTGREIVDAAGLTVDSGAALSRIVAVAERGHFGGYRLGRADFVTCREDYATVTAAIGADA